MIFCWCICHLVSSLLCCPVAVTKWQDLCKGALYNPSLFDNILWSPLYKSLPSVLKINLMIAALGSWVQVSLLLCLKRKLQPIVTPKLLGNQNSTDLNLQSESVCPICYFYAAILASFTNIHRNKSLME